MKIHCPQCQGTFRVEGHQPDSDFDCPFCSATFAFGDKETVILTAAPQTEVEVELESEEQADDSLSPLKEPASARSNPSSVRRFSSRPLHDPEDLTDFRPGDEVAGYRLEEIVGSGGMSVVFRAEQISLQRKVAFKVLRKDLGEDPEFARRFRQEARALAELSHPNIVSVIDQGTVEGQYFLVMEFVEGCSLRDRLEQGKLKSKEVLELLPPILDALEFAHSREIVHRDIKPENILLDANGKPRIADFGLVRMLGEAGLETRLTKTQAILGTLDYMSPEQREGRPNIDHRADLYSLGVVFYELLTGELPIARFPRPSEKTRVDRRIDGIVMKILEKDPDRRYQRASEVQQDLSRVKQGRSSIPGAGDEDEAISGSFTGRLLAMCTSFSTIFFSVVFLFLLAGRDDRSKLFSCGVAVPFYLGQLVYYGLLPRPLVSKRNYFYRHPIIGFGLLAAATGILNEERIVPDQITAFAVGILFSSVVATLYWRKKIFRHSAQDSLFVPWAGTPDGYDDIRSGRLPKKVANWASDVSHRAKGAMDRAKPASQPPPAPYAGGPPPPPPLPNNPGPASAETSPPTGLLRRFRLGLLATPIALLTLLPLGLITFGFIVIFAILEGPEYFLQEMSYREAQSALYNLWQQPLDRINAVGSVVAAFAAMAYAVPGLLLISRVPGFISRRELPTGGFVVVAVAWLSLGFMQIIGSAEMAQWTARYTQRANPGHVERQERPAKLQEAIDEAVKTQSSRDRLACFHRAFLLSDIQVLGVSSDDAREQLAGIALQPSYGVHERVASLILLKRLYGDQVFDSLDQHWRASFARHSQDPAVPHQLREAFQRVLVH